MKLFRSYLAAAFVSFFLSPHSSAGENKKPVAAADPPSAESLFRSGKFTEAEKAYRELLKADPDSESATLGLTRTLLQRQQVDEAWDTIKPAAEKHPHAAALLAAKGDVQFRRAEMTEAEVSYLAAKKLDAQEVSAYIGLVRLYRCYSLYGRAHGLLLKAHEIAPDNIDVQREWMSTLPRKARLAALEAYLAGPHPDDEEETKSLNERLEFLRATVDRPPHACQLVNKVEQTETRLEPVMMDEPTHSYMHGFGLVTKLNDHSFKPLLDTGASGILVGRRFAEKAALKRISAMRFGGIGDKQSQSGYYAVADHIRVGELEFQDCIVEVSDKAVFGDADGLIGSNVFAAFLVDIDLLGMKMRLSPLTKRPDENSSPKSLQSEDKEPTDTVEHDEQDFVKAAAGAKNAEDISTQASSRPGPKDRYVAPEMTSYTRAFRFGHMMLIPTQVSNSSPKLFVLDTGAFNNIISVKTARELGKVGTNDIQVRGVTGEVNKVYQANKATLRFGHLQQTNLDVVTLDLSRTSADVGTEISGFLGFAMLRILDVKIDYRDGLVNFDYDPDRAEKLIRQ